MERLLIFSTFPAMFFFYLSSDKRPRGKEMKRRCTQDINALETQHIKGAFFLAEGLLNTLLHAIFLLLFFNEKMLDIFFEKSGYFRFFLFFFSVIFFMLLFFSFNH